MSNSEIKEHDYENNTISDKHNNNEHLTQDEIQLFQNMYNNYDINSDSEEIEEDKSNEINDNNIDSQNSINFKNDNIIDIFSKKKQTLIESNTNKNSPILFENKNQKNNYFQIGIDSKYTVESYLNSALKFYTGIYENKVIQLLDNNLYYDNFIFVKYNKYIPKIYNNNNIKFF